MIDLKSILKETYCSDDYHIHIQDKKKNVLNHGVSQQLEGVFEIDGQSICEYISFS